MERKIRIAAVNYMNALPLVDGFVEGKLAGSIEMVFETPAAVAALLLNDEADIGLVPVAVIPQLDEWYIISDYCIATDGEVASVCVFSDVPLEEVTAIYADYQSRSSVALLKILLANHWKLAPPLIEALPGYETFIKDTTAGLVIGDRALLQRHKSAHIYDLGTAWKDMTGLPFVFAAWVSNKKLPDDFITAFNIATGDGLKHIDRIAASTYFPGYDLKKYYTKNISYKLDEEKRKAIRLFLEMREADFE